MNYRILINIHDPLFGNQNFFSSHSRTKGYQLPVQICHTYNIMIYKSQAFDPGSGKSFHNIRTHSSDSEYCDLRLCQDSQSISS